LLVSEPDICGTPRRLWGPKAAYDDEPAAAQG
jgi:hypothetical protein